MMPNSFAEIAFTPSVLEVQKKNGSADNYAGLLTEQAAPGNRIGPAEEAFIKARDGFYQATVSQEGWPYVQFRGGPIGFLRVLDDRTIAYADYRGNQQYISTGNLNDDDRVSMLLMDYPNRARLKIWGRAKLIGAKDDAKLVSKLRDPDYRGLPERAVVISINALDWNCPQHISQRLTVEELQPHLKPMQDEIIALRLDNERLKKSLNQTGDK